MSLPEPAWRLKTRPCPFYRQGRCIFATSCNFLHTAPSQSVQRLGSDRQLVDGSVPSIDSTPVKLPLISVESPDSVRSTRSPRLASLLLALKDVLGDDTDDEFAAANMDSDLPMSMSNTSLVVDEPTSHLKQVLDNCPPPSPHCHPATNFNNISTVLDDRPFSLQDAHSYNHNNIDTERSDTRLEDDTPVTQAFAPIIHPEINAINIHGAEEHGTQSPELLSSATHDNFLFPVEISSHFQSANFTRASIKMIESTGDDMNFPLALSPSRSPAPASTFELLASPFRSPGARILSPRLSAFLGRHSTTTSSAEANKQCVHDSDLDSPQSDRIPASAQISPTPPPATEVIFDNIADALENFEAAATNREKDKLQPQESCRKYVRPKVSELTMEEGEPGLDDTASSLLQKYLESKGVDSQANAGLASPVAHLAPNEEDQPGDGGSFTSLYEAYTGSLPSPPQEATISVDSHHYELLDITPGESSGISTPLSFIQDRVFTPQDRGRSDNDSPTFDSPLRSQQSLPVSARHSESNSAFGIQPGHQEVIEEIGVLKPPISPDDGESRKVPFAWRHSLVSNRSSKTSRTSITSRAATRPTLDPLRSPPPADDPPSLSSSPSSPLPPHPPPRLRPLRLSVVLSSRSQQSSSAPLHILPSSMHQESQNHHVSISASSVSSNNKLSHSHSFSSRFSLISDRRRNNLIPSDCRIPSPLTSDNFAQLSNFGPPSSAPLPHSHIWRRASVYSVTSQDEYTRTQSNLSQSDIRPISEEDDDDFDEDEIRDQSARSPDALVDRDSYRIISPSSFPFPPRSAPVVQQNERPFYHAVSTAKPTLMFAIASDDVAEVKRVLESGNAGPNDAVGPQTALEFALTNGHLLNKVEIVKTLLAYGADPRVLKQPNISTASRRPSAVTGGSASEDAQPAPVASLMDDIDPALKYYVERADAPHTRRTSALIHRSFFRPLTRVRYEVIGQDCVLEQLFKVLSIQSRGLSVAPIVVLLCGPSGHGKSLLARKFGSLLDVPTHTVNMTTLRSTHDLWQSHSMSPYEIPTTCTLAEFLINHEGKRCVVVLDEIEKTDEKTLWSLLMPWELGRCSFTAGSRHIDVRNVVWLGTSNIGHDLVFKHQESREHPNELMAREEYVELMGLLRPLVSERLGASVLSRVTTVLPFVPFTLEEKKAICTEALYSLGGEDVRSLSSRTFESVIQDALGSYCSAEGARSLYRAISNQLIDII